MNDTVLVYEYSKDNLFSKNITNSVDLSTTQEATGCAVTQELRIILRIPKVHYCLHKSLQLVSVLN
jgi:hypothetical protein